MKHYLARGWNNPCHHDRLLKYRDRYFKDIEYLSTQIKGDHFQAFYENLAPIDDELEYQIMKYQ